MNRTSPFRRMLWLASFFLLVSVVTVTVTNRAGAKSDKPQHNKIAPDLQESLSRHKSDRRDSINVIIQLDAPMSGDLNGFLNRNGVHLKQNFRHLDSLLVELPGGSLDELANFDEVAYVTPDREAQADGHVSQTTGAAARRTTTTSLGTPITLEGSGIGIAILDSGVYASHKSFTNDAYVSRIVYSKDFTGENRVDDPYGHGTHVAAIAAGNKLYYSSAYAGIAPDSKIINLRVLNSIGRGTSSSVLAAVDWIRANRALYNIKVANMSLGMSAIDSFLKVPRRPPGRRMFDARTVVVAAAGNSGKDSSGRKI